MYNRLGHLRDYLSDNQSPKWTAILAEFQKPPLNSILNSISLPHPLVGNGQLSFLHGPDVAAQNAHGCDVRGQLDGH